MAITIPYEVKKCDLCCAPCIDEYVDGVTNVGGLWGIMCSDCFRRYGVGLGTGRGQRYEKLEIDNRPVWRKVETMALEFDSSELDADTLASIKADTENAERIREVLNTTKQAVIDQGGTPGAWLTAVIGEAVDTMLMLEKQSPPDSQGKAIDTLIEAIKAYATEVQKT